MFTAFASGQAEPEKAESCHSDNSDSDNLGVPENIGNSETRNGYVFGQPLWFFWFGLNKSQVNIDARRAVVIG